jgi:hypothetical protein
MMGATEQGEKRASRYKFHIVRVTLHCMTPGCSSVALREFGKFTEIKAKLTHHSPGAAVFCSGRLCPIC